MSKLLFKREKTCSAAADKGLTSNTNLNAFTHFNKELFSSFAFYQSRYIHDYIYVIIPAAPNGVNHVPQIVPT